MFLDSSRLIHGSDVYFSDYYSRLPKSCVCARDHNVLVRFGSNFAINNFVDVLHTNDAQTAIEFCLRGNFGTVIADM